MSRRWLAGGFVVLLVTSLLMAKPGTVKTLQGDKFVGDVHEDDRFVYVQGTGGEIKLDKRNIQSVTYTANVDDEYTSRHSKLAANDVKGRIDLAAWASDNQRNDLAIAALNEARKIDPMNKDAGRALDAALQQQDMDNAAKAKQAAGAAASQPAGVPAAGQQGGTGAAPATQAAAPAVPVVPLEHRMLNADEVNIIRQKEMTADDSKIKVRFDNNVIKKYLAGGDHDAVAFGQMTPQAQAMDILLRGDPKLAKDVKILTDPAPLLEFKQKVNPMIASACGSTACHGGAKAGDFMLYSGDSTNAVYTNFYILFGYSATIDNVKYLPLDRELPERSMVLQFGLPHADNQLSHPKVANMRTRFKNTTDPAYIEVQSWVKSLNVIQPDYGIQVAVRLPTDKPVGGVSGGTPGVPMTPVPPITPAASDKTNPPATPGTPVAPGSPGVPGTPPVTPNKTKPSGPTPDVAPPGK